MAVRFEVIPGVFLKQRFLFCLALTTATLGAQDYRVPYKIGPGDLLRVSVLDLSEMDNNYRVDTLGNINLPHLGRVPAGQKTVSELQSFIMQRLKEGYLNDPRVMVEIEEFNFRPIAVIGAVQNPGRLKTANLDMNLIEALTQAGGVLPNAAHKLLVMRKTDGVDETLEINLNDLLVEGKAYLNIPIFPGDTINVPTEKPFVVSVIGEVNKPGEYKFTRDGKITILRVIAAAGGFTDFARQSRVIIKREGEEASEFRVNVKAIQENRKTNFEMEHNDVVIVP